MAKVADEEGSGPQDYITVGDFFNLLGKPPPSPTHDTDAVNGTAAPPLHSPDSAIGVTPPTSTPETEDTTTSTTSTTMAAMVAAYTNDKQNGLHGSDSKEALSSEEGYEEDDEGDDEGEDEGEFTGEEEEEEEDDLHLSASTQFPLHNKEVSPQATPNPVVEGGQEGAGGGLQVTLGESPLLKEASPSGCESDIEDNWEEEEEEDRWIQGGSQEEKSTRHQQHAPPPASSPSTSPAPSPTTPAASPTTTTTTTTATKTPPSASPTTTKTPPASSPTTTTTKTTPSASSPTTTNTPSASSSTTTNTPSASSPTTTKTPPPASSPTTTTTKTPPPASSPMDPPSGTVIHLPDTVTRLDTPEGSAVYLVGTAHFSRESQDDVANTIRAVQPDVVVVELCKARTAILQLDEETILQESRSLDLKKVKMIVREHGKIQGVLYLLLLSVSAHITKQLGMAPGGEFRTAFAEARRSAPHCVIQLGDRPIQVTLSRALASLSLWHKVKLTWHILTSKEPISKEEVEKCKQRDFILEMLAEMTGQFPAISEVFVKERDIYLCRSLQVAARTPPGSAPRVVVGVVGIGHVPGIVERWGTVTDQDIAPIMRIPPPNLSSWVLKISAKATFYGLLGYGAYRLLLPRPAQSAIHTALHSTLSSASASLAAGVSSVSELLLWRK